ncbi:hypothetical protein [Caenispirillum bisanense]|uniref:hypothetical protein n=1 Tax=Caenispirillum bisanense TaxID=414052 RepID=UPI0031DEB446
MPGEIVDLTAVRLQRHLMTLHQRNDALQALAQGQVDACRAAEAQLQELQDNLRGFASRLDQHRHRCLGAARRLRRSVEALESGDIDRMIAARDDLLRHMDRRLHP